VKRTIIATANPGSEFETACVHDALARGEAAIPLLAIVPSRLGGGLHASQVEWERAADQVALYIDGGITLRMKQLQERALSRGKTVEHRYFYDKTPDGLARVADSLVVPE